MPRSPSQTRRPVNLAAGPALLALVVGFGILAGCGGESSDGGADGADGAGGEGSTASGGQGGEHADPLTAEIFLGLWATYGFATTTYTCDGTTSDTGTISLNGRIEFRAGTTPTTLLGNWVGVADCEMTWEVESDGYGSITATPESVCGGYYEVSMTTSDGQSASVDVALHSKLGYCDTGEQSSDVVGTATASRTTAESCSAAQDISCADGYFCDEADFCQPE